jgi:hypothetical protein
MPISFRKTKGQLILPGVRIAAVLLCFVFCCQFAGAEPIPFDSDRWEIRANEKKLVDYLGQKSLFLKGGSAIVKDSALTDGIIEFDIAFASERNFVGVMWRMEDPKNYEEFYFRPHQSGNPDANQYQPVFNGVAAWQLLYGERYSAPVKYDFNQWMHVKIVVAGENAEVYLLDMNQPVLFIGELLRSKTEGKVGLSAGQFAAAYFANFSFTAVSNPPLKGKAREPEVAPAGTVMSWLVSSPVDGKSLENKFQLTAAEKQNLSWKTLRSEKSGLANLARIQGVEKDKNTTFARLTLYSESEQIKKVRFGFSDTVKVYFNDRLIYGGSDQYISRDYRFLGTVGLFDELYLPLKKGDNELWFAVTENFGGWGIKALFEDMSAISFKAPSDK